MQPRLSVVTATFNAAKVLPALLNSLKVQTDLDFEWVVADGGSTDDTLALLSEARRDLKMVVDTRPDFGIYDALNRAIRMSSGEYYLVLGADDTLNPDAIECYKNSVQNTGADLITAKVAMGNEVIQTARPSWVWLYGSPAKISAHSVGVCIKKSLHEKLGLYSSKFPIYADGYFLLKAIKEGCVIRQEGFVAGRFSVLGCSNVNKLSSFSEQFQAHVLTGGSVLLQLLLFNLRILKWQKKLKNF